MTIQSRFNSIQLRAAKDEVRAREFITGDTLICTYPVIKTLDEQSLFIAYTMKKEGKDHVMHQRVKVE